jgi:hypothetical protein
VPITNPTDRNMAEAISDQTDISSGKALPEQRQPGLARPAFFKYYIHDGINACRFELLGELNQDNLAEMSGCWQTAKTTLGSRQLILDLRRLQNTDAAGSRWLTGMAEEGASFLPDSFLSKPAPGEVSAANAAGVKLSRLGRVLGLLRGTCPAQAD